MKRWQVALYACDGSRCGTLSQHWTRRGAARRRRIEEADDRRLNQLLGSRWVVERSQDRGVGWSNNSVRTYPGRGLGRVDTHQTPTWPPEHVLHLPEPESGADEVAVIRAELDRRRMKPWT